MLVFEEMGKPQYRPEKNLIGARTRTNNKLNPHITPSLGIEPGPHWREASALTTVPSLLLNESATVITAHRLEKKADFGTLLTTQRSWSVFRMLSRMLIPPSSIIANWFDSCSRLTSRRAHNAITVAVGSPY